ncbi:MAG: leucine-rich repeat domain-containing protein [Alistipes sp.]|nr:leucine-rich repeat domain-containing protein [Alistipes sp.]
MKKLLFAVCALFGFMACTQNPIEEQSAIRTDAPETIKVGFEDGETRIQLNSAQKTVWTKNDLVSVFYKSNANQKWEYRGETGERIASLYRVDDGSASRDMDYVVLAYPYSSDYVISTTTGNIEAKLPTTQYYAEGSYGVGSNLMVSRSEFTQFSLKSVCGWLKLQLTGNGEVIKSIKFRGNNGEQVAGLIYVDTETAEATLASEMGGSDDNNAGGNLVFDDTILTEVVLDCGEGVELGAEATPFYISLPPQTFANGFTVEIESDGYKPMTLSTSNALTIERNTIQPMASVEHNALYKLPNNEIWYTNGSTTEPTNPRLEDAFGVNIISNTFDAERECWVIKFDGEVNTIGEEAFHYCSSLTSVTIPDGVTSIGAEAFASCSSLTSVTIPDSVTKIGDSAFDDCSSLTSVTIGDSVTTIGESAFGGCSSLTSVTIPDSVTEIGISTFAGCDSLTSVTIGDSVTTIGKYAFSDCRSLTSITIPDSVTKIGNYAFYYCISLKSVYCKATTPPAGGSSMFSGNASGRKIYVPMESVGAYKAASYWCDYMSYIVGYDF